MADAPKKEETAQKEDKPKVQNAKEAKAEAPPPPEPSKEHHPKISKMSLPQIEKAIEHARKHMGGLTSQYGRILLARKAFLTGRKV